MKEYMIDNTQNQYNTPKNNQEEIADVLKKQTEIMKHDITVFTRLAQYYYGTDGVADYSLSTWEETQVYNAAHLYTLIKYQGKDLLVHVGTGEFNTAVFTRRDIQELKWFSHSPLPLFVVSARAEQEHKEKNPKKFLNEHALIYSPKWWQAEFRNSYKSRENGINYGNSNGIMEYNDASLALKNAEIHKTFSGTAEFKRFLDNMKKLKEYTPQKLQIRSTLKEDFISKTDETKIQEYKKLLWCMRRLSDGKQENMYNLIQSFDIHKQAFIKQDSI